MKKIILIFIILISGCEFVHQEECPLCDVEVGEMDDYVCEECDEDIEIKRIKDLKDVIFFVKNNIKWTPDNVDEWQLPEVTYNRRNKEGKMLGDCEDFSIISMYLINIFLNLDTTLLCITNPKGLKHIIYMINDFYDKPIYVEPESGMAKRDITGLGLGKDITIVHEIPYPEVMWMTYYYGNNVGKYY